MAVQSKYECFVEALKAAAVVADVQHEMRHAAGALDLILANSQTGIAAIIDNQTRSTPSMILEYVDYVWSDGDKPDWLEKAGL